MASPCAFCNLPPERTVQSTTLAVAIRDGFPVSPGHTLIIPRRHVASFFEITEDERTELMNLLGRARVGLDREFRPAGYNIGVNDGAAAGKTVSHLHIHLIPRFPGDREDPRGGVRWVLPEKAAYWSVLNPDIGAQYFRDVAAVVNGGGPPDRTRLRAVMARYGLGPAPPRAAQ